MVDFGHVAFDAIEVALEGRLADEVINFLRGSSRFAGQGFLLHQQQTASLVREASLLQRVVSVTDPAVGGGDAIGARVHPAAGRITED